jgi:5-methylcytosine-specific restriction endonuclease McrA
LKTCLTLLGRGARYEVEKFRAPGVREKIESEWTKIARTIADVLDFVRGKTFIRCDKALSSYLVLIPLIYVRYHYPESWASAEGRDTYLLRSSLTGGFSGTPDQLIDDLVKEIERSRGFSLDDMFGVIRSKNRSLELTEDRFWSMGYGSDQIHLLFNIWYRDFNYTPAYENNLPQIDHIFPQSLLRQVKTTNPSTGRMNMMRYHDTERNQLANCMLLTRQENGAAGKSDTPPDGWFVGHRAESAYLRLHLIPEDRQLWKLERFEDFIAERKKLIAEHFKPLFVSTELRQHELSGITSGGRTSSKNLAALIGAGVLQNGEPLSLTYKGRQFEGTARPTGIELPDRLFSPSDAALPHAGW